MESDLLCSMHKECIDHFDKIMKGCGPQLVFGDGCSQAPALMLIGEAPGEQEEREGRPFVGKAGQNLNAFLQVLGFERTRIYLTNVVKFRPTRCSAAGRIINRPPTRREIEFFLPWVRREILLVNPKTIVTLGNVALQAIFSSDATIGMRHGRWMQANIPRENGTMQAFPLFPLYHPAAIIYKSSLKEEYQRDLHVLKGTLRSIQEPFG